MFGSRRVARRTSRRTARRVDRRRWPPLEAAPAGEDRPARRAIPRWPNRARAEHGGGGRPSRHGV